jgi:acyl-coenzyme A thioesterase PaaI-like protein
MRELPHTSGCFVCGESNASGMNLRFETDGNIVQAHFLPRADHVGFKQVIHGGILATLLDEIMVWGCAVRTRRFGYCAEMTVRFLQPVRPGVEILAIGELVADKRGRLFEARGELRSKEGLIFATSTGKYIPLKQAEEATMFADFVGDASEFAPQAK